MNGFGRRLENLREKYGYKKEEVSSKLGFSKNVYGAYEREERTPSFDTLKELSILFETSTDYLITGKEYRKSVDKDEIWEDLIDLFAAKGIDQPYFMQIEKWSVFSKEDIKEVSDHFEWVYQKAKFNK